MILRRLKALTAAPKRSLADAAFSFRQVSSPGPQTQPRSQESAARGSISLD